MTLAKYLDAKLKQRSMLLMTHLVVGYPSLEDNWQMLEAMQQAGVDLVELQYPFSEPIADGPLFIRANQGALANGIHRDDYFSLMGRAATAFDFPLLFMGYYNTVFKMGHAQFCARLADAGARGMIVADLPPELALDLKAAGRGRDLDFIHLMTPTNGDARLRAIAKDASGFVYCVARKGVTGRATDLGRDLHPYLARCRRATPLPLGLGFGIRSAADLEKLRGGPDIAIVGSAGLDKWEREGRAGFEPFIRSLADAAHAQTETEKN